MQQKRLLLATTLSLIVLLAWIYFFAPKQQPSNNSNVSLQQADASPTLNQPTLNQPKETPSPLSPAIVSTNPDNTPQRTLIVQTPLYDVKLDSKGAVVTSWILKKVYNPSPNRQKPLYSVGGTKNNPMPLELISPEGLKRTPRETPFRVEIGDQNIDALLRDRNYVIGGIESSSSEATISLSPGFGSKKIDFVLRDEASGVDITKSITFKQDRYDVDVEVKMTRGGQPIPQVMLLIGPSIGDQGVPSYSFYSVAPQGISVTNNNEVHRLSPESIYHAEEGWFLFKSTRPEGPNRKDVKGEIDWAGVCDTYFAMLAVPSRRTKDLVFRTLKYEHLHNGSKEDRYLLTAYVPIPADGSKNLIYVGPKDHDLLTEASKQLGTIVGRKDLDLDESIDYGLFSTISRPIAIKLLWCINKLNEVTGNYGASIIIFTIVIYSFFFPLKWKSSKSMKRAQKHAPRMKEVQEKMKGMKPDDPRMKELQMEQLRLMKEANPLGGCLPLLIQMPFLFALYRAITISIDFRLASFLWIPDLSAPEPYIIHILPILMASSLIVLQWITPSPTVDPAQRFMMTVFMPLFMLYILWSAPAGLLVYWLVGNLVGFGQQLIINRLVKSEDDKEPPKETETSKSKKLKPAQAS
jgi:YidC/Oxa1 family membrane protein insertase